eukprot:gene26128-biopygen14224
MDEFAVTLDDKNKWRNTHIDSTIEAIYLGLGCNSRVPAQVNGFDSGREHPPRWHEFTVMVESMIPVFPLPYLPYMALAGTFFSSSMSGSVDGPQRRLCISTLSARAG